MGYALQQSTEIGEQDRQSIYSNVLQAQPERKTIMMLTVSMTDRLTSVSSAKQVSEGVNCDKCTKSFCRRHPSPLVVFFLVLIKMAVGHKNCQHHQDFSIEGGCSLCVLTWNYFCLYDTSTGIHFYLLQFVLSTVYSSYFGFNF